MAAALRRELEGTTLRGGYRLGPPIGRGGTGVVHAATRLGDGKAVVVKALRAELASDVELRRRLRREGEVARRVFHPGIVPVLDEGTLPDRSPFLVLEAMRGESLAAFVGRRGLLSEPQAAAVGARVASILHSVHRRGYVHRDVKPEHILLDRRPSGNLDVYLLDFGVCAAPTAPPEEREAERARVFGTPAYCSPEQASGEPYLDGRADLFALGVTLFEALSGKRPFRGTTVDALLRRILREDAPRVMLACDHVGIAFDAVVATLLARDPGQRFQSARSAITALGPFVGDRVAVERAIAAEVLVRSSLAQSATAAA